MAVILQNDQICRYIHTPSSFARQNLLYIQETGRLKSRDRHISRRIPSGILSFLYCIVRPRNSHYRKEPLGNRSWRSYFSGLSGTLCSRKQRGRSLDSPVGTFLRNCNVRISCLFYPSPEGFCLSSGQPFRFSVHPGADTDPGEKSCR